VKGTLFVECHGEMGLPYLTAWLARSRCSAISVCPAFAVRSVFPARNACLFLRASCLKRARGECCRCALASS